MLITFSIGSWVSNDQWLKRYTLSMVRQNISKFIVS